jgi:uncharacterized protein (TIGR00369 family)
MDIITHNKIDFSLCGKPLLTEEDFSKVELKTSEQMSVDQTGLVHGGFIFGLADHAAMIAVNHPNVVLGAAEVKFLKPVKAGETVVAEAKVEEKEGKKNSVTVSVSRGEETVFKGTFICFVLEKHVLG